MSTKKLTLSDTPKVVDNAVGMPVAADRTKYKTEVIFKEHGTGKVLGVFHNKVLIAGSRTLAQKMFGYDISATYFPSYNTSLSLPNSEQPGTTPTNQPICCLFCCGTQGCGAETSEIFPVKYTKRIQPSNDTTVDLVPFRYPLSTNDLDAAGRTKYFGRKPITTAGGDQRIAYYFKAFENIQSGSSTVKSTLNQKYIQTGDDVPANVYDIADAPEAETYVEMNLSITKEDFREYFTNTAGGINSAKINSISLLTAWYTTGTDTYIYYQDIVPFTQLNIANEPLIDLTKGIDITYHIYF